MKVIFGIAALFTLALNQSHAADGQELKSIPCEEVTLEFNSRQRWEPGFVQYGIQYEAWTPEAFDMLRDRALECSNPDAQSFGAYIRYLEGINVDALRAMEENRRQRALAEAEAKRKAEVEAEWARAQLQAERERIKRQAAEEAERNRQAEWERQALLDQESDPPETAITEPQPAHPNFPLDEDVKIFVKNNPQLTKDVRTLTQDDLMIVATVFRTQAVVELSLMLCNERWSDFPGQQEEASRRIDLLRRVYFQYLGLPLDKFHEFRNAANQVFETTQTTDYLLADINSLYEICQQSLVEVSYGFNFAQD
jgi:hypothetical protein